MEQAHAVEVWRGPASAVLGGNALHGAVNVINAMPKQNSLGIEVGSYDYGRMNAAGRFEGGQHVFGASFVGTTTNGYRDNTGYGWQKLNLAHATQANGWAVNNQLTATLNQETGASVRVLKLMKIRICAI